MDYDAIVIGSGQAGVPLALGLADHGWSVALIEAGPLGGTCVNTGCTPTKTLIHRAQVAHYARHAARWGVRAGEVSVDLARVVAQKDALLQSRREGLERQVARRPKLRLLRGTARFARPHEVAVGEERLASPRIFLNTGARPQVPDLPGLESVPYHTNESLLNATTLPEHLVVLGGGYVGLEFGQMFARFGSRVTIVQRSPQILPREDAEVARELQRALEAEGIRFLLGARATGVARMGGSLAVRVAPAEGEETLVGSDLLVAAGRRPNTDALGLEMAGVEIDREGYVRVNDRLETSVPGIWALGDVKGGPAFTHISYNDYQIVFGNLVGGGKLSTEGRVAPYCVFTDPQLGRVGLTEKEARRRGVPLKIGRVPMSWVARALERDETAGLMKLVVDATTDRILGACILGVEGGEVVQILAALMLADQPYTRLQGAVYIHPTLAEGLYYLMDEVKPAEPEAAPRAATQEAAT